MDTQERKLKAQEIVVNKGGFLVAGLFNEQSSKDTLIKQPDLQGNFLHELNIDLKEGDVFKLKDQVNEKTYKTYQCKVYNIEGDKIECEFI